MIHREDHDGIALLRIEHGKANILDLELCSAIVEAFDDANEARAVVLTGTGTIFSAGVDLFRVLEGGASYIDDFVPVMGRAFERIFIHPAPVVSAANGHAIAGGCLLVAAADQRLMAQGTGRIGIPELQVGVPFPPIALEIMRFATPPQHFQTIAYRAGTHEPPAALALGLIDEVVESDELIDHALALAERLASVHRETFAITKREIRRPALVRVRALEQTVAKEVHARWLEPGTLERIRGYLDRTIPKNR
ncbi:MAG: enoyl-CoA hydratase/isomerase family protein [Gammaproteobacteria bacterium]|nr:enoyl-CoA hydratase/isomerase family protein [Gammaproteobacteria bacterium]